MQERIEKSLRIVFAVIVSKRWWIVSFYILLLAFAIPFAVRVEQDNAIDKLIVKDDPDYIATYDFSKIFGSQEYVVIFVEVANPFDKDVIAKVDAIDSKLKTLPNVSSNSLISIYRRAKPDADPINSPDDFRQFALNTDLFRKQGLIGEHFYSIPLILDVKNTRDRSETLNRIDESLSGFIEHPEPLVAIRKVGESYVNDYLNIKTTEGGMKQFPVFLIFVVILVVGLYRSLRALVAIVISMGVNVALAVGFIGLIGGTFTIVSVLIPMTIMVTCLATLVYIHSRFVERPEDRDIWEHQIFALANKFVPCTASIFAGVAGFAALGVSEIRPIKELGIWLSVGLTITWIVVFTLFPVLQRILKTPTQKERKTAAQWFWSLAKWLPRAAFNARWVTVPTALLLCGIGAIALFGLPGYIAPMKMLTDPIDYVSPNSDLYRDTKRVGQLIPGLSMSDLWLKGEKPGIVEQTEVIRGLDYFQSLLEQEPMIGSVVGPTSVLRMLRYVGGNGDILPEEDEELESFIDFDSLVKQDPLVGRFINFPDNSQTHITLVTRINEFPEYEVLSGKVGEIWAKAKEKHPALGLLGQPIMVGMGRLQAKVGYNLVPTLVESFILTVLIIFSVFLLIFRNTAARLMAMIPSLFAILVMFIFMRLFGMSLNVATILIASTVLGTSENDQIHFFYHFLEGRSEGKTTEYGLRHTLIIAGRSVFFATLINAIGFLAFAVSDLPPIRQFAILAALAFSLSMIADFTALPGALWMIFKEKPNGVKSEEEKLLEHRLYH